MNEIPKNVGCCQFRSVLSVIFRQLQFRSVLTVIFRRRPSFENLTVIYRSEFFENLRSKNFHLESWALGFVSCDGWDYSCHFCKLWIDGYFSVVLLTLLGFHKIFLFVFTQNKHECGWKVRGRTDWRSNEGRGSHNIATFLTKKILSSMFGKFRTFQAKYSKLTIHVTSFASVETESSILNDEMEYKLKTINLLFIFYLSIC